MLAQDVASAPAAPSTKQLETISISIGLGAQGRSSSIVLPREHDLVRHLERLLPAIASASPRLQDTPRGAAVSALASMASAPQPPQSQSIPQPQLQQYLHANARYETTSAAPVSPYQPSLAAQAPLYPSAGSISPVYRGAAAEPRLAGTRRRRGAAGNGKKCQVPGCDKISVSRGLCRGHGGGRRCQHAGCTKGAQSRSDFCWAHGGGQRCEVKGCMRSRKSKRFCVAHLSWENAPLAPTGPAPVPMPLRRPLYESLPPPSAEVAATPLLPQPLAHESNSASVFGSRQLPSLQQALRKNLSPVASRP